MKCPSCGKGELREHISLKGIFRKRKVYTYFCPLCNFEKIKEIPISVSDSIIFSQQQMNKQIQEKDDKINLNIKAKLKK